MGENSKISWTDHTFNPWIGCARVSPACENCYAERQAKFRTSWGVTWGVHGNRSVTSLDNWKNPRRWDRAAAEAGVRARVFCASLADVFEDRPELVEPRKRLWDLVVATPNLDWLLLTKRPENLTGMLPWRNGEAPIANVLLGTTAENQKYADLRIPKLLEVDAAGHFVSMEPLLGGTRLDERWLFPMRVCRYDRRASPEDVERLREQLDIAGAMVLTPDVEIETLPSRTLSWVIVGGESGAGARPMHPKWARDLRDQCLRAGVPFHFKQWGEWAPYVDEDKYTHGGGETAARMQRWMLPDGTEGDCWIRDDDGTWSNWTGDPPKSADAGVEILNRWGKKRAGRTLDGLEWNGLPLTKPRAAFPKARP